MVRCCVRVYCEAMSRYETSANRKRSSGFVMSVLFVFYGIYAEKVLLVVAVEICCWVLWAVVAGISIIGICRSVRTHERAVLGRGRRRRHGCASGTGRTRRKYRAGVRQANVRISTYEYTKRVRREGARSRRESGQGLT